MKTEHHTRVRSLFLHLLTAAIWDREVQPERFNDLTDGDWRALAALAHKQSVNALVADKVLSLPGEVLPPRALSLQFLAHIEQTKAMNNNRLELLGALKEEYARAGFPFVLMKGLVSGHYYPNPLLRNPGDMDILLFQSGDYEKSFQWAVNQGYDAKDAGHIHYNYPWHGVTIEPHSRISYFDRRRFDTLYAAWEQEVMDQVEGFPVLPMGFGGKVVETEVLPVEMNAFFLFHHMFRHFIQLGVGLRHVCDWVLFLHGNRDRIDAEAFEARASSFALLYPMQVFAGVAVEYLDAPEDIFPFPLPGKRHRRHVRRVGEDILKMGNFGFHKPGRQRPGGKYAGMWFSFVQTVIRSVKFAGLSVQHIPVLPFKKLWNRLRIGLDA